MNLSLTVGTSDRRIMWAGTGLLRELDIELPELVGRSIDELVEPGSAATIDQIFAGPPWTDRSFEDIRIGVPRPFGRVDFDLRSVLYIDRDDSHVAFIRFERAGSGDARTTIGATTRQIARAALGPDTPPDGRPIGGGAAEGDTPPLAVGAVPAPPPRVDVDVDELTGLPLRARLLARLEAAAHDDSSAVVVVDIDQFGRLNARLGSEAGDEILAELGGRLAASVRGGDFAARLSGDRFAIVGAVTGSEDALALGARVDRVLSEPFVLGESLISIATSIGASWGQNSGSARRLFEQAEIALDQAQTDGGRQLRFFDGDDAATGWPDLATFAADLRAALGSGQIFVAYQPIVELGSGRLEKLEALARWTHPDRGNVPPNVFIPLAERSGTIGELGEWILDRACADSARLAAHGLEAAEISVNMSVAQLREPGITNRVTAVLAAHAVDAATMWIEVTESVLLDDAALVPLRDLHDLGLHLVIDDFGTGYATFQYLTRLPFDALKIDTTFVAGLGVDASDTAIVRSVINLARELGLQVIAEGVETESQRAQLVALECRLAQGWLFARAMPFDELVAAYGSTPGEARTLDSPTAAFDETHRLAALRACRVLDTSPDAAFDSIAQLATQILRTPIGLVTLIDSNRQWFKARVGIDVTETTREVSFCTHAIANPRVPFVVGDTLLDERFVDNPFVADTPNIRSYAGVPIRSREGLPLGTLCVLDIVPRDFSDEQITQLTMLAGQTGAMLDLRRRAAELNDMLHASLQPTTPVVADHVDVTETARHGASAVGRAVVELTRVSERRGDAVGQPANVLRFGSLELHLSARTVWIQGDEIDVSAKEFDLLAFLASNPRRAFTRVALLHEVWRSSTDWQNPATVTEHIYRLRSKIEVDPAHPRLIRTIRGIGYRFEPPLDEPDGRPANLQSDPRTGEFTHDDLRIVAADAGMLDMLMTSEIGDIVGHEILDVVAPSSRPAAQARLEMRASGHAPGPQVIALQTSEGSEVVTLIRSEDAEFAALPAVIVSVREIVDPPHLSRQLVHGVVNEVSDAVIVTDTGLHVLSWNPAAERLYGWSEREVLGHTLQNVVRALQPIDLASVQAEIEAAGRWSTDASHVVRNGTIVDVVSTISVVCDDAGAVIAMVVVNRPERERAMVVPALGHDASNWSDVQRAVSRNEFVVYYEPVVRMTDRAVVGVNVRVRWLRPDGGTWDLADFIADVARARSLGDLARYVYPTAFLQFEQWRRAGRSIELTIDVSARQLADEQFLDALAPVIVRLRVAGSRLWLRVTESVLQVATTRTRAALQSLSIAGARIAVADLGSGWASAQTLRSFEPDALAFDSALFGPRRASGVGDDTAASAVVALANEMGIPIWIENVEDQREHDRAARLGCVCGSGPFYGGPTLGDHLDVGRRGPASPGA